jgi:glycosyltransferase involved in cell wall biosynthesis
MQVSLVTLGDPDTPTGGYLYHRRMAELAADHDVAIGFVSFPSLPFPAPGFVAPKIVRRASAADAIVLDSIAAAFWWSRSARPLLVMAHQPPGGIDHGRVRTQLQAKLDRRVYGRAKKIMVASDALGAAMETDGVASPKIVVVPPGRDVAEPTRPPRDLRGGKRIALLCVGNWVVRKGIVDLLDAVARLPSDLVKLHLVGDPDVEPAYATQVRARLTDPALEGRVEVHGVIPRGHVAAMYRDADAFVLPSVREPYGTVYGEAMAFGLPVVGWDAGNLPHLAGHDEEGLIVPQGALAALADALERLATDASLRERLGRNALARAQSFPTWDESAALFFSTIRGVVEAAS